MTTAPTEVRSKTWRDVVTVPKFVGLPKILRDEAWKNELYIDLEVEKGWWRDTVRFSLLGEEGAVDHVKKNVYDHAAAYNQVVGTLVRIGT